MMPLQTEHLFECPSRLHQGAEIMALVNVSPVPARIRWDRIRQRPREIRWGTDRRRVIGLDRVRDERAAYPSDRGPRLTLVVRTDDGGRASLSFDGRGWIVDAVEDAA
jgi:hypothetical protein